MDLYGGYNPLLPLIADRLGTGAAGFGLLSSAPGLGALLGTAAVVSFGDFRYKGFIMIGAVLTFCLWLVGLGMATIVGAGGIESVSPTFSGWFFPAVLCTFLLGASDAVFTNPRNTLFQL